MSILYYTISDENRKAGGKRPADLPADAPDMGKKEPATPESNPWFDPSAKGIEAGWKYCMNCGNKLPDFAKFCNKCGAAMEY